MIDLITLALAKKGGSSGGVTPEQLEAALATKEDKCVIVYGEPNEDFSQIPLTYNSAPITGSEIYDLLISGKDVVIYINGGENVYVVMRCVLINESPNFTGVAFGLPGMPDVSFAYGSVPDNQSYLSVEYEGIGSAYVYDQGTTELELADNTEYFLEDIADLTILYPSGSFECWISLTTAASGTVTVTLPASQYIGSAPAFGNGETWEISIKNGIVVAVKVGDGT